MKSNPDILFSVAERHGMIFLIANIIAILCVVIILLAILIDFVSYHRPEVSKKKKNSLVETGSMLLYFFFYCLLMQTRQGRLFPQSVIITSIIEMTGISLVIAGCFANIAGRIILRHNWANQVTIYQDQTLVTGGVYRIVRHPLYASLIWMLLGGCLIYIHYIALLSVFLIFIPMMYYRAKQEEKFLVHEFKEYSEYMKRTGMLFPKIQPYEKI
jgi:protein-S-isoprenylcysteine O-methyltransferase Ste14